MDPSRQLQSGIGTSVILHVDADEVPELGGAGGNSVQVVGAQVGVDLEPEHGRV